MIRKILVAFLLITSINITAQRTSSSPYSFFGIGKEFNPVTVEQSSMGGIGVAFSHYRYLNFTNPAAYANLRSTTYTFGLLNNDLTVKDANGKQKASSTSLSYFALAFPIGKEAGFSFGIQPVSSIGYSLSNSVLDTNGDISENSIFSGNGGVNRFYGSFGIKVFEGFSLGIEGDFNFGKVENEITNQRAGILLGTKFKESSTVRGSSVSIGAQYEKVLKKRLVVNAGAVVKLGNDLKVEGDEYLYSLAFSSLGTEIPRDTVSSNAINGNYRLPIKTTIGAGVGELDKWYAGVEYANQNAIETSGFLNSTSSVYKYGNSNRVSLGGFYIPKINSISSYWDRVTYRAGVRFTKTGLLVNGTGVGTNFTAINDFGISFGLGLPLANRYSNVNMGFEFGKKGTTSNNLIQENYFNFRLSLSLTDISWFQKRKID